MKPNKRIHICMYVRIKGKKQKQEQNKNYKKKKKQTKQNKRERTHIEERCRTAFSQAKYLKISLHLFYK